MDLSHHALSHMYQRRVTKDEIKVVRLGKIANRY